MEILAKLYLELATVMPPECVSLREKTLLMRIEILEKAALSVCRYNNNDEIAHWLAVDRLRDLLPSKKGRL